MKLFTHPLSGRLEAEAQRAVHRKVAVGHKPKDHQLGQHPQAR